MCAEGQGANTVMSAVTGVGRACSNSIPSPLQQHLQHEALSHPSWLLCSCHCV